MDKRKVVEPFLYIDQPLFQKPSARMQEQYYSKASEEKMESQKGSKQKNKKDIKFKYLTIQQKVDYLLNLPGEMPRLRCEIVTDEGKYRGIIIDQNTETVLLRVFGRDNEKILKAAIQDIRLLGF